MLKYIRNNSFIKFCIVGGGSTLLDLSIYLLLFNVTDAVIAKIVSMGCSMVFSYNLNKRWSFRVDTKKTKREIGSYFVTQLVNLSVNVGINSFVLSVTNMKLVAFAVATLVAMTVNYTLQKVWVFRKRREEK